MKTRKRCPAYNSKFLIFNKLQTGIAHFSSMSSFSIWNNAHYLAIQNTKNNSKEWNNFWNIKLKHYFQHIPHDIQWFSRWYITLSGMLNSKDKDVMDHIRTEQSSNIVICFLNYTLIEFRFNHAFLKAIDKTVNDSFRKANIIIQKIKFSWFKEGMGMRSFHHIRQLYFTFFFFVTFSDLK